MKFLTQDEKVIKSVRKSWLVLFFEFLSLVIAGALPYFMYNFALTHEMNKIPGFVLSPETFEFFFSLWILILWTLMFVRYVDFYLDQWVLTNERLIDIDQKGFFNRQVSTLHLDAVQDITIESKGLFQTMFNLGTITVQTAATEREFVIRDIPNPEGVKFAISEQVEVMRKRI
ncbi:MAG: PH domain-containing protein [Candidatus Pacebacteria bacterium]|nr:PH domain-containing protein [Candidatus Paceibacterota bacterium]